MHQFADPICVARPIAPKVLLAAAITLSFVIATGSTLAGGIRTETATVHGVERTAGASGLTRTAPDPQADALRQRLLERENETRALQRAQARGGRAAPTPITVAPEVTPVAIVQPRAGDTPTCTAKQDPESPLSPAEPKAKLWQSAGVVSTKAGIFFEKIVMDPVTLEKVCHTGFMATWEEFWDNAESQDIVLNTELNDRSGLPGSESMNTRAVVIGDSLFVASMAASRFNSDKALLIAAAKAVANPKRLNWKLFRIQLTKLVTDGHFCTPAADALVFAHRVGILPSGRLFVAFDSFADGVTTGSILSIDARSLLSGGPALMKCFTGTELAGVVPPNVRDDNRKAYFLGAPLFSNVIKRFVLRAMANVADDTLTPTPDINVPDYAIPPAAVQPNGSNLYTGGSEFRTPSTQIGDFLWNVHTIDDGNGRSKVRLYKFSDKGTAPLMTLTLATLANQSDHLFAPSVATDSTAPDAEAFITFTRTVPNKPTAGLATLMMARGPNSSATGWTSMVLMRSPGQVSKNALGGACDPFIYAGCQYGPDSATVLDPAGDLVWGFGQIITKGTIGGAGSEKNWMVKGIGVPR